MNYDTLKTDTSEKIINFIENKKEVSAKEISQYLNISPRATFKQLSNLLKRGQISKIGTPPKVYYFIPSKNSQIEEKSFSIDKSTRDFLDQNYITITPYGDIKSGFDGFSYWCEKNQKDLKNTLKEYVSTIKRYRDFKNYDDLINGKKKLFNNFKKVYLDEIYYLDFNNIETFGKTKLGTLLFFAKIGQDKNLIKQVFEIVKNPIYELINNKDIDSVSFIPPTVQRETQFQKEMKSLLNINLPKIKLEKIKNQVIIPQKTLNKIEDRVENASKTIFVKEDRKFKNILLIDDEIGSGATLNVTAKKIREKGLVSGKIIGLALIGSFNGFDVLNEI